MGEAKDSEVSPDGPRGAIELTGNLFLDLLRIFSVHSVASLGFASVSYLP